jgi:hypothetical protein
MMGVVNCEPKYFLYFSVADDERPTSADSNPPSSDESRNDGTGSRCNKSGQDEAERYSSRLHDPLSQYYF